MRFRVLLTLSALLAVICNATAADEGTVASAYRALVPDRLLALLHAPEIHRELNLSAEQVAELERLFSETDGPWFRSRIQTNEKRFRIVDALEQQVHDWLARNTTAAQRKRLHQLEMQAQSVRMLLRRDMARDLKLTDRQQEKLAELAKNTQAAQTALQQAVLKNQASEELRRKAEKAGAIEQNALKSVLDAKQRQRMWQVLGEPFDTTQLRRIYPMAPEFVSVPDWINSKPLTLKELRGKVLLVHFYAFGCHNCHANFPIYRRWHNQLRDKGVVVIGIQTPETARERDPAAVRAAAEGQDLKFPIMIDLQSENWKAWGNTMWPTIYVVDRNGYIRHWWQGELNWQGATGDKTIEQFVNQALSESPAGGFVPKQR